MNKFARTLLASAALLCATAHADTVTVGAAIPTNIIVNQETDWNDFLQFQKFDSSLGTLTGATIDLYANLNGNIAISNDDPRARSFDLSLSADLALGPDASPLLTIHSDLFSITGLSVAAHGNYSASTNTTASGSVTYTAAPDLAMFAGPGSFSLPIAATSSSDLSSNANNYSAEFTTMAGSYANVTYSYISAVPEPETYGMMLAGLGMLGLAARRKASKSA